MDRIKYTRCSTHLFFYICAFHQIEIESKWKSKLAFIIHKRLKRIWRQRWKWAAERTATTKTTSTTTNTTTAIKTATTKGDSDFYERREKCFVTLLAPFMASVKSWLYCLTYQLHWNAKPPSVLPFFNSVQTSIISQSAHCLSACLPAWLNIYAAKLRRLMLTGQKLLLKIISLWSKNCKIFTKVARRT